MDRYQPTKEELRVAREWAADESRVERKAYEPDEECLECVGDILAHPAFQPMDDHIQYSTTTCKTRCIQVPYMSLKICGSRGRDYCSAAGVGLLHDLFLYDRHIHARETGEHFHGFTYPRKAMNNAVKYFGIFETEKNLILCRTWPLTSVPSKHIEGYVVLYADELRGLAEVGINVKRWLFYSLIPRHLG